MKARTPPTLAGRLRAVEQCFSDAGVGVISPAQATLGSWPPMLELDEWEELAMEQQDALMDPDSDPASWALIVERDAKCFFDGVPPHLWPLVQTPASGPGSRVGLRLIRPR